MAAPKHKQPSVLKEPIVSKTPRANPIDWWSFNPAWRISRLEVQDPFGWHVLDERAVHEIRQKLANFERLTLHEIFVRDRKYNHPVEVQDLCANAQRRLVELRLEDVEHLYTLRLSGTERVWGILDANVLILLWWDPHHEVCPSEKKHT